MDAHNKTAVVTGANRGIGLEICKQLARKGVRVIMTSRDVVKGRAAVRDLAREGLDISFHQLDVTDAASIRAFAMFTEKERGGVDILINNAGVLLDPRGSRLLDLSVGTLK